MASSADATLEHLKAVAERQARECREMPHWSDCRRYKVCVLASEDGKLPKCEKVTARMWLEALQEQINQEAKDAEV